MELRTTKEEMIERFKLCGEIMCLCASLTDDDTLEDFCLEWYKIQEQLGLPEDKELIIDVDQEDSQVSFDCVCFSDDFMPLVEYQAKYASGVQGIWCNTTALETIKCYIERYCKSLKDESK